jgi:hypothetical protein
MIKNLCLSYHPSDRQQAQKLELRRVLFRLAVQTHRPPISGVQKGVAFSEVGCLPAVFESAKYEFSVM